MRKVVIFLCFLSSVLSSSGADGNNLSTDSEQERMRRMTANLLRPELKLGRDKAAQVRAGWGARYVKETDPLVRMEIITEMQLLDDRETIRLLLEFLQKEKDSGVRQQIVLILGYMRTTQREIRAVAACLMKSYEEADNSIERERILVVMSDLPAPDSVSFAKAIFERGSGNTLFEQKVSAAKALYKLGHSVAVTQNTVDEVTAWVRTQAQSGSTATERFRAAQLLAMQGQSNRTYLGGLVASETDPKLKRFLMLASTEHPTE